MLGELVVRPNAQRLGMGRAVIGAVEDVFPGIPVHVKALGEAKRLFEACGYRPPPSEMTVMSKNPPLVSA
jgi:GNAT superfamily N-acetyltransferase